MPPTYIFNGMEIIESKAPSHSADGPKWLPCEHLKPLLTILLSKSSQIENVDTGWSRAKLVITTSNGFTSNIAKTAAQKHGLTFYANNDSHYLVSYGLYCEFCQQGIDWPQDQATINEI